MTTPTNGGPAFPQTNDAWYGKDGNPPCPSGMSLRDWFAGQAMLGQLASPLAISNNDKLALYSYQVADAMLRARNQ